MTYGAKVETDPLKLPKYAIAAVLGLFATLAWIGQALQYANMSQAAFVMMITQIDFGFMTFFLTMWITTMIAMMFPSLFPMVSMFMVLSRKNESAKRSESQMTKLHTSLFVGGWLAFYLALGLGFFGAISIFGISSSIIAGASTYSYLFAGLVLLAAGAYQLGMVKFRCLTKCRSPLGFLLTSWRSGYTGSFRMGISHGIYCGGCCWLLMAVWLVLGAMSLFWMGIVALVAFFEKTSKHGMTISKLVGLLFIALGTLLIISPNVIIGIPLVSY